MAKKKNTGKTDRWASQAAMEALLKFGPQEAALAQTRDDAVDQYKSAVKSAQGAAAGTVNAIDAATPAIAAIYNPALNIAAHSNSLLSKDLGGLTHVADSIRAGAASEAATQIGNLNQARTGTLTDLVNRRVAAKAGVQYASENARQQLASDLGKIFKQKQELAGEKGTFAALTTQQLEDAANEDATKVAIASNHDATTAAIAAGHDATTIKAAGIRSSDKGSRTGKVSATGQPLQGVGPHNTARNQLSAAEDSLKTLDPGRDDRHGVAPILVSGHKGQQVYVTDKAGKRVPALTPGGTPKVTPTIDKTPQLLVTAAADQYYDGHISRETQKQLADAGYSIKQLGLTTYAEFYKTHKHQRPVTGKSNIVGNLGRGIGGSASIG